MLYSRGMLTRAPVFGVSDIVKLICTLFFFNVATALNFKGKISTKFYWLRVNSVRV